MIKEGISILDQLESTVGNSTTQREAWKHLREIGLPQKKSEAYKFTAITAALEKNIDWAASSDQSYKKELLYDVEGSHVVLINGVFAEGHSSIQEGLTLEKREVSGGKHDPFSLLNTSLALEEIYLEAGSTLPIFIYHFHSKAIANPRIKIHVKQNESINVIEKFSGATDINIFNNSYVEFEVGKNAQVYHTKVQNYHSNSFSHETVIANVGRDGKFYNNTFSFEGALIRNNLTINLESENCEGHMYGLFLLDKKSHVDNSTSVDHIQPNSYSNEVYKGILDEKATGVFNGKIYVRQDAQKTNAFQANNNILLSDEATIHTKPQLEIWADDVKCSHGCTSGQLDNDAIFYLRARGINEKNAKAMLLNAFASETTEYVKVKAVKEEVQGLIDKKLV